MFLENTWDGKDRLCELVDILGVTDDFSIALIHKWLKQCVSMALNTFDNAYGADGVLVLAGPQGAGKTSFFRKLAVEQNFFLEGSWLDFHERDTLIRSTSAWITELAELETTFRSDTERLKSFITQAIDRYRRPYGRSDIEIQRNTSFCATCNSEEFLIDTSGNRRFWTIPVQSIDLDKMAALDAKQLWSQIYLETKNNLQQFRLNSDEQVKLTQRNKKHEKMIRCEAEIRDLLSMIGNRLEVKNVTVTDFKNAHDSLRSYSVEAISLALNKMKIVSEKQYTNGKQSRLRALPMPRQVYPNEIPKEFL